MNAIIKKITADKVIARAIVVSLISFTITALYVGFSYTKLPPLIPLLNQAPWGDARITAKIFILLPLVISMGIFVINVFVAAFLYEKIPLLSRIVMLTTFLISILSFIFYFRTLQLIL